MPKKAIVGIVVAIAVSIFGVSQATAATSKSANDYTYKQLQACASKTQAYNLGDKDTKTNKCISILQEGLVDAGYSIGKDGKDGVLGADTSKALNLFKEGNGLEGNSWAGYGTYQGLADIERNVDYRRSLKLAVPAKTKNTYSYLDVAACASKTKAYNLGDKDTKTNKCVAILQEALANAGYSVGKDGTDGELGSDTVKALNLFKKGNGLEGNGWAGYGTYQALATIERNADYIRWLNTKE